MSHGYNFKMFAAKEPDTNNLSQMCFVEGKLAYPIIKFHNFSSLIIILIYVYKDMSYPGDNHFVNRPPLQPSIPSYHVPPPYDGRFGLRYPPPMPYPVYPYYGPYFAPPPVPIPNYPPIVYYNHHQHNSHHCGHH